MPRWLTLQPAAVGSAAAAVYLAAAMLYRAVFAHTGVFAPDELVAAIAAVYGLWARGVVTPLARPRNKAGQPLVIHGHVESSEHHHPRPGSR